MAGGGRGLVAAEGASAPRIDRAVLVRLVADLGPDQVVALCDVFVADAREGLSTVRAACSGEDADGAARTAHRLKSSCGFLGTDRMAGLCGEIEHLARDGRIDAVEARIDLVSAELDLLAAELAPLVDAVAADRP